MTVEELRAASGLDPCFREDLAYWVEEDRRTAFRNLQVVFRVIFRRVDKDKELDAPGVSSFKRSLS